MELVSFVYMRDDLCLWSASKVRERGGLAYHFLCEYVVMIGTVFFCWFLCVQSGLGYAWKVVLCERKQL